MVVRPVFTSSTAPVDFIRDDQGRLSRVTGSLAGAVDGMATSIAYRYDAQNRLILARDITRTDAAQLGTPYGYEANGLLLQDSLSAHFGAALNWANADIGSGAGAGWAGTLAVGQTTSLGFTIRESEIASTIKVPGGQGAVIVAITTQGSTSAEITGATVLGTTTHGATTTTLVRVTEAGLKLIRLSGEGAASVQLRLAGDINRDGVVDGADSAAFETVLAEPVEAQQAADIDGDGQATQADRQVLYANYGLQANRAPVAITGNGTTSLKTHTDLATRTSLGQVAQDLEGDSIFWRVLGASHGTASLSADGQSIVFMPEAGYSGQAQITVQADDGFAASAPMELGVNVSGARLLTLHVARLSALATGQTAQLQVTGDFEDQDGVLLTGNYAQYTSTDSSVVSVSSTGAVRGLYNGTGDGIALVQVQAQGIEGVNVFTVSAEGYGPNLDENGFEVDVYPRAITLPLMGQRQLKVTLPDTAGTNGGVPVNISAADAGTRYFVSDAAIAEVSLDGLIMAKATGTVTLSIINQGRQHDIRLNVQQATVGTATVTAKQGAVVQDTEGNLLMVAPGALPAGTRVSINTRALTDLGMPLPATTVLDALAAVDINIGDGGSELPVQLAVKVNGPIDPQTGIAEPLEVGTEVFFWQKGKIRDVSGIEHDTWWLVDNGIVGADGMARTSSPPYSGIVGTGTTLITKSKVNLQTGAIEVAGAMINWNAIWAQQAFIAMAPTPMMAVAAIGIFATAALAIVPIKYTLEGSYSLDEPIPANDLANIAFTFPSVPNISVQTPDITGLDFNPTTRKLRVSGQNFVPPGQSDKSFKFSVWLQPRAEQISRHGTSETLPDRGMVWQGFTPTSSGDGYLEIDLPEGISLSMHNVYVERTVLGSGSNGSKPKGLPVNSDPVQAWILGTDDTLVTTARSIHVFRATEAGLAELATVTHDELGRPLALNGRFGDAIAYANDGTLAFIAGANANIYVYDTQTLKVIHTIHAVNSTVTLTSLAVVDGWLYASEGREFGATGARLIRINIDQLSVEFLRQQQVVQFDAVAPYGFADMAVNNGSYLALTAPLERNTIQRSGAGVSGNVYVLDLAKIGKNGVVPDAALLTLGGNTFPVTGLGKVPQYITSGNKEGEFLLSGAKDGDLGAIGLTVMLNAKGGFEKPDGGVAAGGVTTRLTPEKSDSGWFNRKFQQNIQRAAGNVVVNVNGKQYALVADYNFLFNDPHFNEENLYGYGKQIGGKIGVIEDPFGTDGGPRYLGATTPIVGGAIDHLTLGSDGFLYADVFLEDVTTALGSMYKSLFVWDAAALVKVALEADARGQRLTSPIDRINGGSQQISEATPARFDGPMAGTSFGWTYGIGAYTEPGKATKLNVPKINVPVLSMTPDTNINRMALGITNLDWERAVDTKTGVLSYIAKDLFYSGWNLYLMGFPERNAAREFALANQQISADQYLTAMSIDSVATVGAIALSGVAGNKVAGSLGIGLTGQLSAAAAGGATATIVQTVGEVATYHFTVDPTSRYKALGIPLSEGLNRLTSSSTLWQLSADTVAGAGLGWIAGLVGSRLNLHAVYNSPTVNNPLPVRVVAAKAASDPRKLRGTLADSSGGHAISNPNGTLTVRTGQSTSVTIHLPPKGSMSVGEAQAWMKARGDEIPALLNKDFDLRQKAFQAVSLQEEILLAGRNALRDGNALGQMNVFQRIKTYDVFQAEAAAKGLSGNAAYKQIIDDAVENTKFKGCFVAGTLVHTKEGLKPIEQIQVGDYVLSKPESGKGKVGYKKVLKTFEYEDKEVWYVEFLLLDSARNAVERGTGFVATTGNHPFWVVGRLDVADQGGLVVAPFSSPHWLRADELEPNTVLLLSDGRRAFVSYVQQLAAMSNEDAGWLQGDCLEYWQDYNEGRVVDFSDRSPTTQLNYPRTLVLNDVQRMQDGSYPMLTRKVFNIEVEDHHTYFVGELGVWVHNQNCGEAVSIKNKTTDFSAAATNKLTPTGYSNIYNSRQAFEQALPPDFKGIGAFYEAPINKWWSQLQAKTDGSLTYNIGADGGLHAFGLGYKNPFGGSNVSAMADVWVPFYSRTERLPSNFLMDTKAGKFGFNTPGVDMYVNPGAYAQYPQPVRDTFTRQTSSVIEALKRDSAALNDYKDLNLVFGLEDAAGIPLMTQFIKKAVMDPQWVGKPKPMLFEPVGLSEKDWFSDRIYVTNLVKKTINGEELYVPGPWMTKFTKVYGLDGLGNKVVVDVTSTQVRTSSVIKPLDLDSSTGKLIVNVIDSLFEAGVRNQEVVAEGPYSGAATLTMEDIESLLPTARKYWTDQGALASVLNDVLIGIDSLPQAVAGQTQGNQIVLSDDGAGWGWFVDATPTSSDEFLPDTLQQVLRAQVGGVASGKLDLLTVIIHELGHVLGAQDLARTEDVMSGDLAPGVRRLPSAEDVAAWLAAQSVRPSNSDLTDGFGVRLLSPTAVPVGATSPTQLLPAARPVNSQFLVAQSGWTIEGSINFDGATGAMTLTETADAQTSLMQAFNLGANDRYLSFTVDGLHLNGGNSGSNIKGPADAFEVALLDPTTYQPLLDSNGTGGTNGASGLGWTHSDASLNLQATANGLAERAAAGVTRTVNADGSTTYSLDLRAFNTGSQAGRAVLLSFDLLGFGAADSSVTLRDIRLGSAPQAVDDTLTVVEDTPTTFHPLANDVDAAQPGLVPTLASGPQHGSVVVNPDGSLTYTPHANYNGPDSFTYQVGPQTGGTAGVDISNPATVSINVTAANDAPQPADGGATQATVAEDTPLTLNLLAHAVDVDGDTLTLSVDGPGTSAPLHGSVQLLANGSVLYTPDANYHGTDSLRVGRGKC